MCSSVADDSSYVLGEKLWSCCETWALGAKGEEACAGLLVESGVECGDVDGGEDCGGDWNVQPDICPAMGGGEVDFLIKRKRQLCSSEPRVSVKDKLNCFSPTGCSSFHSDSSHWTTLQPETNNVAGPTFLAVCPPRESTSTPREVDDLLLHTSYRLVFLHLE